MTTAELFNRVISHSTVRDPAKVPFDLAVQILDGMNDALAEYYALAPARFSRKPISALLPAAVTVSVSATNGSPTLGASVFTAAQTGRSVVVGDDAGVNQVVDSSTLLDAYLGTSGTVNATVYGDAYAVENEGVRQVLSAPRLADGRELKLDDGLINRRFKSLQNVGKPYRYCWENTGESAGGTALAILRVDPIPSIAYVVRMEVWTRPLHLTYSHLTAPVALPVPLDMERHLVALCRWHLIGNEIFPEKPDTEMKADAAREAIEDQSPVAGRSQGKIFTPKGW